MANTDQDDLLDEGVRQAWERARTTSDPVLQRPDLLNIVGHLRENLLSCHPDLVEAYWDTLREQLGGRFGDIESVYRRLFPGDLVSARPAAPPILPAPPRRVRPDVVEPIDLRDVVEDDGSIKTESFQHLRHLPEYQNYLDFFLLLGERRTEVVGLAARLAASTAHDVSTDAQPEDQEETEGADGTDAARLYEEYEEAHRSLTGDIAELATMLADHLREQEESLPDVVFAELTDVWRVLDEFALEQTGFRLPR